VGSIPITRFLHAHFNGHEAFAEQMSGEAAKAGGNYIGK